MKNGPGRFEYFLKKAEGLMQQAAKEINPALWLYQNDARTIFFMLEALGRLYMKMHNEKKFSNLKEHFKALEDGFGSIDFYESYGKIFAQTPGFPEPVTDYQFAQMREKVQHINDLLQNEEWITEGLPRFKKIRKKLKGADWLSPKEEAKAIKKVYEEETDDIKKFVKAAKGIFTEMESQVHELRRSIRWLSIYPHALQGMIQLTDSEDTRPEVEKYQTPDVTACKYNVMPAAGSNSWFIMLEKKNFYALSWVIEELGKIKDEGLKVFAAVEALQQAANMEYEDAYQKTFELLQLPEDSMKNWLNESSKIINDFTREKILDDLLYCLAHTPPDK